jgi:hypothetical protein
MDQPLWLIIFQMHGMSTGSWNWALGLSNKILCWTNEQRDYKHITPLNLTSVTWYLTNILVWACGYVFLLRRFPLVLVVRVKSIRSVARDWRRSLHCEDQSSTCNLSEANCKRVSWGFALCVIYLGCLQKKICSWHCSKSSSALRLLFVHGWCKPWLQLYKNMCVIR